MGLKKILALLFSLVLLLPQITKASVAFNPNFIISDAELQNYTGWDKDDVQKFLDARGSYLRNYRCEDANGVVKSASDIIYDASQTYQINPKFLLVTLQKEQSLVTDDSPTQRQLDWATGYAVCDGCNLSDPKVQKHKGFGKQVDDAAGIMRWYYDNKDKSYIKKKDSVTLIDNTQVVPVSWATGFLYTYTPHLHGNQNFWRIWQTWFAQVYPNGSLLKTDSSSDVWLIQDGKKRRFANKSALVTRVDPELIITVDDTDLNNYEAGSEIAFPNYSILKNESNQYYLLDYDTLRPFAGEEVVRKLGYNPQEIIDASTGELSGYPIGSAITATTTHPEGVIYKITDLGNSYYLLKDNLLYPLVDKKVVDTNFKNLAVEKHKLADIKKYETADLPVKFKDGTLIKPVDGAFTYVMDNGLKRKIADKETFIALGYKKENVVTVPQVAAVSICDGEPLFMNASLLSAKDKFLGDSESEVKDLYKSKIPAYLVAEYPSGRIITGKDIDSVRPIASLTKLLTAYEVVNQNFDASKITTYSAKKYSSEGNPLQLVDGEKIKNNDLLNATLIASVNNTARMIARSVGMSEKDLITSINDRMEGWGADSTKITDVTGLDSGNKSSARDLLKIFTKVLAEKDLKTILGKTDYTFKEALNKNKISTHTVKSTNKIISMSDRNYRILASKTGYTDAAQSILLMLIESKVNKKQFIIVVLGNNDYKNRFVEPNNIAKWISKGDVKIAAQK